MTKRTKSINPMLLSLVIGCMIYGVLGEILIFTLLPLIYQGSLIKVATGFGLGVLVMIVFTFNMYAGLKDSLSMSEADAQKSTIKGYIFRIVVVLVLFVVILVTNFCNPIAAVCGMFSLKVAAYLQPVTEKFIISKIIS